MKEHYRVIALDVRGHGLSGKPYGVSQYGTEMVEDVVRLMDHLGLEKAHVAGYSMGGFITLKLIATHPDRLKSAMVCGAGWENMNKERVDHLGDIAKAIRQKSDYAPLLAEVGLQNKGFGRVKVFVVNRVFRHVNDPDAIADAMDSMVQLAVSEETLRANEVPTLSIVGSRDTLKAGVDAMTGVMANHALLMIQDGDHYTTILKKPFREGMRNYLDKQTKQ